ncbi:inorganic phosphate transporter [Sphingomonas nostoxanthinifaciens]|uniref:inorganic phosphate transporter n=1 Tax=Sphingomonas nostoxanthinifaciens TaxID=2872652 RepID=UPI001CC201A4|nr:inorganic phosphate transporter [Sphingomonas nostoxanthinifaciens]UAK23373.1 inorganic phosphate transporter [Sphingomonas nostoxanthinifaciens]
MATTANLQGERQKTHVPLDHKVHPGATIGFFLVLLGGLIYAGTSIFLDTQKVGEPLAIGAFAFLGVALLIALGFEFVNGFHDTANAVATVIYTHSLKPVFAVIWSGTWNFIGVLVSTGAVAYSIITLLPVELILNVGSAGGYAMIFALLIAAVTWNLGTWYFGLPNSSSHALIGSILGVGLANQLLSSGPGGTSGVEWSQAESVLLTLLVSPIIGFVGAMLLIWAMKRVIPDPQLYREPQGEAPPPFYIRALLVFTCTAVSFAHGGNDGQKGMGLIMLILIGVAPTAYALNRTMPDSSTPAFIQSAAAAQGVFHAKANGAHVDPQQARAVLEQALRTHQPDRPEVYAALDSVSGQITDDLKNYGSIRQVPAAQTKNLRNEMYVVFDTLRLLNKDPEKAKADFPNGDAKKLKDYQSLLEKGTRFIPRWVKVAVALALGLGTMIGWKRIVVTVGEKIGKTHLTYGMGAAAELMAASTILLAQFKGMPVSTTHILSSGIAGTMVGNGAGLQASTVRNIALAWVLTLPAAMAIAGVLYALFIGVVHATGHG